MARKKKPPSKKRGKRTGKKGRKKSPKKPPKQKRQASVATEATDTPAHDDVVAVEDSAEEAAQDVVERAEAPAGPAVREVVGAAEAPTEEATEEATEVAADGEVAGSPEAAGGSDETATLGDGDEPAVIDLDADLDGDEDDEVQRLIAQTVAIGTDEESDEEPDEPAIDLDAELVTEPDAATEAAGGGTDAVPEAPAAADADAATATAAEAAADAEGARPSPDLGPTSSPEVRDRLLAEALAHAEHKDARYRVPFAGPTSAARWKVTAAGVILLVAGLAAVAPPRWARPAPPARLGVAERAQSLRVALVLQAQQVEAFRVRMQRLPTTLDEVGATLPGIRYVRSGNRAYQLIAYEADGNALVYDSATPIDAPGTLGAGWAAPQVTP